MIFFFFWLNEKYARFFSAFVRHIHRPCICPIFFFFAPLCSAVSSVTNCWCCLMGFFPFLEHFFFLIFPVYLIRLNSSFRFNDYRLGWFNVATPNTHGISCCGFAFRSQFFLCRDQSEFQKKQQNNNGTLRNKQREWRGRGGRTTRTHNLTCRGFINEWPLDRVSIDRTRPIKWFNWLREPTIEQEKPLLID